MKTVKPSSPPDEPSVVMPDGSEIPIKDYPYGGLRLCAQRILNARLHALAVNAYRESRRRPYRLSGDAEEIVDRLRKIWDLGTDPETLETWAAEARFAR